MDSKILLVDDEKDIADLNEAIRLPYHLSHIFNILLVAVRDAPCGVLPFCHAHYRAKPERQKCSQRLG